MNVESLSELKPLGHDILINATGVGSASLRDVRDQDIQMIRGQTIVVKHRYDKVMQRDDGKNYTYAIPRLDGTVILGGVRQHGRTYV
jgi:glycine/D-amino acid oxidase-like deaminating enzyme